MDQAIDKIVPLLFIIIPAVIFAGLFFALERKRTK